MASLARLRRARERFAGAETTADPAAESVSPRDRSVPAPAAAEASQEDEQQMLLLRIDYQRQRVRELEDEFRGKHGDQALPSPGSAEAAASGHHAHLPHQAALPESSGSTQPFSKTMNKTMNALARSVFLGVLVTATRLATAEVTLLSDDDLCSTAPYGPGCPCYPDMGDQCAPGFACSGNKTKYDSGTCGGDVDTITCPRDSPDGFIDIWIQNTTSDYCANTQIRTCNDENGCVGVKYRNDTSTYLRCPLEYGNPTTGHLTEYGLSLPAKLRIGKETKYITFVCDPKPGVRVPLVSEYWPNSGWPKSMPPMGKSNCSHCTGDDYCPWNTIGPGSDCECCTRCTPDDGSYPPQYNIMFDNPTQHPWKIQLDVGNSKDSTCVLRHPFYGPRDLYPAVTSMVTEWRGNVDVPDLIQVPPGAVNFTIGIPSDVIQIVAVPLYTSTLSTCVIEDLKHYGAPKHIKLTDELPPWCKDNPKGTDCGQDCHWIA